MRTSPPESQGVGSSCSEIETQRTPRSPPGESAANSRPQSERRDETVSIGSGRGYSVRRLRQDAAEDACDLLELGGPAGERGRELDHRVPAIIRAADQAALVELAGEEAAKEPLGFLVREPLLGLLVLHQLQRVEEPVAAHVTDDRDL